MKKQKVFNDFETLSTYNYVGKNYDKNSNKTVREKNENNSEKNGDINSQQQNVCREITVISPQSIDEINKVILSLKNNQTIILDLTYKKDVLTQKVLNYLSGAVFALEGTINKLMNNTYLIMPKGASLNYK